MMDKYIFLHVIYLLLTDIAMNVEHAQPKMVDFTNIVISVNAVWNNLGVIVKSVTGVLSLTMICAGHQLRKWWQPGDRRALSFQLDKGHRLLADQIVRAQCAILFSKGFIQQKLR